jgi:hypothetical protein
MASSRNAKVFPQISQGAAARFHKTLFSSRASKQECRARLPNRHYLKWIKILFSKKNFSSGKFQRLHQQIFHRFRSKDFSQIDFNPDK